jgi:azurin
MKKVLLSVALSAALVSGTVLLTSCGGNQEENKTENTTTTTTTTPDTTKNTANADTSKKVLSGTDITLRAQGNDMTTMHFSASEIHVPANTEVNVKLINEGTDNAMQHNFVVLRPEDLDAVVKEAMQAGAKNGFVPDDKLKVIAATTLVGPGASTYVKFKTPEAGKYKFICSYPGHYQKMQGDFIVE